MKDNLLISFSGGETSAYMTWWIWNNWKDKYNMIVVFANTGEENEETLEFVNKFSIHFNIPIVWVEALVHHGKRKGSTFRQVSFETASRNGEPFRDVVSKYGLPNQSFPHCTRELKAGPIQSYPKSIGWKTWYTAIGIRNDEVDRMSAKRSVHRLVYPLITDRPMTKLSINFWWSQQPFRLMLRGYQGNCKACWKKSDPKLYLIARETPSAFSVQISLEEDFGRFIPDGRLKKMKERGEKPVYPVVSYRKNRSVHDIYKEAEQFTGGVVNDSEIYDLHNGSCEVFTDCGIDN